MLCQWWAIEPHGGVRQPFPGCGNGPGFGPSFSTSKRLYAIDLRLVFLLQDAIGEQCQHEWFCLTLCDCFSTCNATSLHVEIENGMVNGKAGTARQLSSPTSDRPGHPCLGLKDGMHAGIVQLVNGLHFRVIASSVLCTSLYQLSSLIAVKASPFPAIRHVMVCHLPGREQETWASCPIPMFLATLSGSKQPWRQRARK